MLYPSILSNLSAYCLHTGQIVPPSNPVAGGIFVGKHRCLRVTLKGGHYFDAPEHALIHTPERIEVGRIRTGMRLLCPATQLPIDATRSFDYDYSATDNKANIHRFQGRLKPTLIEAELLGWLVGDGTISNERQSIRFTNKDTWCLTHVQQLVQQAFPQMKVSWYAKNVGFDLTLTAGINNPLRHFLRSHQFYEGFPTCVGLYGRMQLFAFLRGLWGADGWASSRKGGADVDMGLSRSNNSAYTSLLRFLHARFGMSAQRRDCGTDANPDRHRLIFSGYRNYAVFREHVGQIGGKRLTTPPIRRTQSNKTIIRSQAIPCYEAPVQSVRRLSTDADCYEVASW